MWPITATLMLTTLIIQAHGAPRYSLKATAQPDVYQVMPAAGASHTRALLKEWKTFGIASALNEDSYLAMCATIRDEMAGNLVEWVRYHALIGVGRFMLFDHNSSQPVFTSLEPYVRSGLVDVFFHASHHRTGGGFADSSQGFAYEQCIRIGKMRHTWMAFIDADEYIFVRGDDCPSLPSILSEYESFGALGLNWVMFGSSGHVKRPAAGNLMSYTKCLPYNHDVNTHVKSIVNLRSAAGLNWSPHHFSLTQHKKQVNELKVPFEGPFSKPPSHVRIMLYHYFTRSMEEFERKSSRGSASGMVAKSMSNFHLYNKAATETCDEAVSFWPRCCGDSGLPEQTRWLCSGVASQAVKAVPAGGSQKAGARQPVTQ